MTTTPTPAPPRNGATSERWWSIDQARGLLLVLMLLVHVISRYAGVAESAVFHRWFGVFLVSAGFVSLSGYVIGARPGTGVRTWVRAFDSAAHLVLVMLAYGAALSLIRHGLRLLAGGPEACTAMFGWTPPSRFEDLGILLPIAIVAMLAPLARIGTRWTVPIVLVAAVFFLRLPEMLPRVSQDGLSKDVLGVLAGRTLTPYYTVSTFVAMGLVWAVLGRYQIHRRFDAKMSVVWRPLATAVSIALAIPDVSALVLEVPHRLSMVVGAAATILYWSTIIACFTFACGGRPSNARRGLGSALQLLGRNSLLVFVLHDVLLELTGFILSWTGTEKGTGTAAWAFFVILALLILVAHKVERSAGVRFAAGLLLLDRSRHAGFRTGPFSATGGLATVCVLAVYSGALLARTSDQLEIDNFELGESCPAWWRFGELHQRRVPQGAGPETGNVLQVRGEAPGMFAHGMGLFLERDIGERSRLELDVKGYGRRSGRMKIELVEDDNGNWSIEKDPRLFTPMHDDRLVYELPVDWKGWRHVVIPLAEFRDDNTGKGNDVFDPARDLTSGGLLEMQLMFAPAGRGSNEIRIDLDNLRFIP